MKPELEKERKKMELPSAPTNSSHRPRSQNTTLNHTSIISILYLKLDGCPKPRPQPPTLTVLYFYHASKLCLMENPEDKNTKSNPCHSPPNLQPQLFPIHPCHTSKQYKIQNISSFGEGDISFLYLYYQHLAQGLARVSPLISTC